MSKLRTEIRITYDGNQDIDPEDIKSLIESSIPGAVIAISRQELEDDRGALRKDEIVTGLKLSDVVEIPEFLLRKAYRLFPGEMKIALPAVWEQATTYWTQPGSKTSPGAIGVQVVHALVKSGTQQEFYDTCESEDIRVGLHIERLPVLGMLEGEYKVFRELILFALRINKAEQSGEDKQ